MKHWTIGSRKKGKTSFFSIMLIYAICSAIFVDKAFAYEGMVKQPSSQPFDEEAARPKSKPGVWTTDADAVRTAAAESGKLIVTLCANYETCDYTKAFAKIVESSTFLDWAKANGVYLLTMDESRMPQGSDDVLSATEMFDYLYLSIPHDDSTIYYPTLAISYAWDPEQAIGFDVARSGKKIGGVAYTGTAATLISGLSAYLTDRPAVGEGENKIVYALRGGENAWNNPKTYSSDRQTVLAEPTRAGWIFKGWYPNDGVIKAGSSGVKTFTALWQKNEGTCEIDGVTWTYYCKDDGVVVGSADGLKTAIPLDTEGEVLIPESIDGRPVIGIGTGAFYGCGVLTRVRISASVKAIGMNAFGACPLTGIDVDSNNAWFTSDDGVLYNHDKTTLIRYPLGKSVEWPDYYEVPASVTRIASFAFARLKNGRIRFQGDAPQLEDASCFNSAQCLIFYSESANGWMTWSPGEHLVWTFVLPKQVSGFTATQGTSPFGVLLKWTVSLDKAIYYTLTRSDELGGEETVLLAEDWYSQGWYLDSTAQRGKVYYYSIVAQTSAVTGDRGPAISGYSAPPFDPSSPVKTYEVRFHANGGVGTMEGMCVTQGICRVLSRNTFVNGDNKFYGWATAPGGNAVHGDCEVVFNLGRESEVVDLYAVWSPDRAISGSGSLTVLSDYQKPSGGSENRSFSLGQPWSMIAYFNHLDNPGYKFAGWSFAPDGPVEISLNEQSYICWDSSLYGEYNKNVIRTYARWDGLPYTISYVPSVSTVAEQEAAGIMEDQICVNGEPVTLASNRFVRAGYVFDRWRSRYTGQLYAEGEVVPSLWQQGYPTIVMEAQWRYPIVNFRYDANGGEGEMPVSRRTVNGTNTYKWHSDNAFYKNGFVLAGWSSFPDGDVEWLPGSYLYPDETWTEGRELVFYAVWRALVESPVWSWADCRLSKEEAGWWEKSKVFYDGYVIGGGELRGTVAISVDDQDVTAIVVGNEKQTLTCVVRMGTPSRVDAGDLRLTVGHKGFYGMYGEFEAYGGYNGFSVKGSDEAQTLGKVIGYYTLTLSDGAHMQLTVNDKGVVAVNGTFADGSKLSSTAQVILGESAFYIPVFVLPTKTTDGLRVLVRLTVDEENVTVGTASKVMVDRRGGVSEELTLTTSGRIVTKIAVRGYDPGTNTACGVDYCGRVIIDDLAYPAVFAAKGLPPGLTINADTGVVSGVPTMPGRYVVSVTVSSGIDKSQKTTSEVEMSIDNYTDETMPVADAYGPYVPGVPIRLVIPEGEGWSVSGLAAGTKWDKSAPGIVGTPMKPGASTVIFSWKEGSLVHMASSTFVVGPLPTVSVSRRGAGTGKITGAGGYAANDKVVLNATADTKDDVNNMTVKSVFAGWYLDAECLLPVEGVVDYRTHSFHYVMPAEDVELFARFVPSVEDEALLAVANIAEGETFTVGDYWTKKIVISSHSLPTVTVKGLPAGLKFDAKTLMISGKPTKPGKYDVELSLKNMSIKTAKSFSFKIVVPNLESSLIAGGINYKPDAYMYIAGSKIDPVFPELAEDVKLSASGLPAGLKLVGGKNGVPYSIEGTSTAKPGSYTVTLNLTKGKEKDVATFTMNIENRTLALVPADCAGSLTNGCMVTGGGSYAAGKKVTLKATAAAYKKATANTPEQLATVFAGWFRDSACTVPLEGSVDFRTASYVYVTKAEDETIYAKFVPATEDVMIGLAINGMEVLDDSGDVRVVVKDAATLPVIGLASVSIPKASVKGLPAGMKWDAKANRFTGAPTKPGLYKVSVSLMNTTVKKAIIRAFTIEVPNFVSPAFPRLAQSSDAYQTSIGVSNIPFVDCTLGEGFEEYAVKVTGLPAGLKYTDGRIVGVAGKAGTFTVYFTGTKKGASTQTATITISVAALPEWVVGTFSGGMKESWFSDIGHTVHDKDYYTILNFTVSTAGKVSMRGIGENGKTVSVPATLHDVTEDEFVVIAKCEGEDVTLRFGKANWQGVDYGVALEVSGGEDSLCKRAFNFAQTIWTRKEQKSSLASLGLTTKEGFVVHDSVGAVTDAKAKVSASGAVTFVGNVDGKSFSVNGALVPCGQISDNEYEAYFILKETKKTLPVRLIITPSESSWMFKVSDFD